MRKEVANHCLKIGAKSNDISCISVIAAVIQRNTPLFIHNQNQTKLTQVSTFLFVLSWLRKTGATIEGMDKGIIVRRIIKEELLFQRKVLRDSCQHFLLD